MRDLVPLEAMRAARTGAGLSRNRLAALVDMTAGDVGKIESGRLIGYPGQLRKIEGALDIEPGSLGDGMP